MLSLRAMIRIQIMINHGGSWLRLALISLFSLSDDDTVALHYSQIFD